MGKIFAISSSGKSEKSFLDLRFGKCEYVFLHDASTGEHTFIENPFKNTDYSGVELIKLLKKEGVSVIVTGEVGPLVSDLLAKEKLQLVLLDEEKIKMEEIVERISSKKN